MPRGSAETTEQRPQSARSPTPFNLQQDGSLDNEPSALCRVRSGSSGGPGSASPSPTHHHSRRSLDADDGDTLDKKLRRLSSCGSHDSRRRPAAGQRIIDYENAPTPPTPRQAMGFKVVQRSDPSHGTQLADFPNEILTHILSHLHPDSQASVALVSKRFYALVTTPHAWRMAFMRYFPGHTVLKRKAAKADVVFWPETTSDLVRLETRYFGRLTPLATWRSEYLFRTRLVRSLVRGKPGTRSGGIGSSGRTSLSGRKKSAVLTYNSKLPWLVTNIHAVFSDGKQPTRAVQGAGDLGVATMSDPTSGKIEKWGFEDPFSAAQLDEVVPDLVLYGLGDGPAATPNVMDVSQPFGMLSGEGFPGGRAYFRGVNEMCGRYLDFEGGVVDTYPDIPKMPEMSDAICSVWIAKSSAVPATTQSMCGMLTGSALGVVTAYSLGWDSSGPRYANGDMTARWVLSPGVPITCLKVDDSYSVTRKSSARVWAVALNALGEVYYLTGTPATTLDCSNGDDVTKHAWHAGRSVYWHLLEDTRRVARPDELDKNAVRGAYSPRSSSDAMGLSRDQLVAETREIERFFRHKPAYFRKVCEGWDMQRRLEVDFAADDGNGAGEAIFVIDCGMAEVQSARIRRFSRLAMVSEPREGKQVEPALAPAPPAPSLFAFVDTEPALDRQTPEPQSPKPRPSSLPSTYHPSAGVRDWHCSTLDLVCHSQATISAGGMDCSSHSLLTLAEDALHIAARETGTASATANKVDQVAGEIPGRRARLLAVGTTNGAILVWNARELGNSDGVRPLRIIQTDSPEISCLAVSALYIVHGGSDGLVQAWDPLASTTDPIRTLNARCNGRVPRHMMVMNPALRQDRYPAVGDIYLDPDPTVLRGVLSFGASLRYWTYGSAGHPTGRKRRLRHSDIHGRLVSRRLGGIVSGYIAAEEAELRREKEQGAREQARLRKRFGLGALGDLTEEEALHYVQVVSEEAYLQDEQHRASDSAADASLDTASSLSEATVYTVTPELDVAGARPQPKTVTDHDGEFEQQMQQAIRLSLLGGVNDLGQSPQGNSSSELEYSIKYKLKGGKRGKQSGPVSTSPSASHAPMKGAEDVPSRRTAAEDEDLALALRLSMQDRQQVALPRPPPSGVGLGVLPDDFPPLDSEGFGKGKGVRRW